MSMISLTHYAELIKALPSIQQKRDSLTKNIGLSTDDIETIIKTNVFETIQNVLLNHGRHSKCLVDGVFNEVQQLIPDIDRKLFDDVIVERKQNVRIVDDYLEILTLAPSNI